MVNVNINTKMLWRLEYVNNELNSLWEEYRRLSNPQTYKVDLSRDLWYLKTKMIDSKKFI